MSGPLKGLRIIEIASIGPGPFCCMMLADHGAEVIRIDRPGGVQAGPGGDAQKDVLLRSRRSLAVDLKSPEGVQVVSDLVASADGLVEGFRPGVMERLGLGPDRLAALNRKLVFGRMTGWGQNGPYAHAAGHDINYIALAGALHAFGRASEKPTPPINLIGDFGGGGMMLAFGMVGALLYAGKTGEGQVVDCAMTDGTATLMSMVFTMMAQGSWRDQRGVNLLDTGAHFYDTYETSDGKFISLGAIEPQFYALLREKTGLGAAPEFDAQMDQGAWPELSAKLAAVIATKSRDEWCTLLEHSDACFAPVLSLSEAPSHPHNVSRGTFIDVGGVVQPAPAPRFSKTISDRPTMSGQNSDAESVLREIGYASDRIKDLRAGGVIA